MTIKDGINKVEIISPFFLALCARSFSSCELRRQICQYLQYSDGILLRMRINLRFVCKHDCIRRMGTYERIGINRFIGISVISSCIVIALEILYSYFEKLVFYVFMK